MPAASNACHCPLNDIFVLDFSTLVPGPLATLFLAEAGAEVLKIERPVVGDEMRHYAPVWGDDSATFALLNRGKESLALDLKASNALAVLMPLIERADILVEQFRPGVMDRLGLGYDALAAVNPGLIYCSISSYGQNGPRRDRAGHDLNMMAESGVLDLSIGGEIDPSLPPIPIADVAGGTYPALVNILLALVQRSKTGKGGHLDIALSDHLFFPAYWALAEGWATGKFPSQRDHLVIGASPRYNLYRTSDDRFLAVAAVEQKFWDMFCAEIGLAHGLRRDEADPAEVKAVIGVIIRARSSSEWRAVFADKDCCCSVVEQMADALQSEHYAQSLNTGRQVESSNGARMPALPVPLVRQFQRGAGALNAPRLEKPST